MLIATPIKSGLWRLTVSPERGIGYISVGGEFPRKTALKRQMLAGILCQIDGR
jgi:hypothetical protein